MRLLFALLLISTSALCQSGSFIVKSQFDSPHLQIAAIQRVVYYDIKVCDSIGTVVAYKLHGKEWVIKDAKKAVEILIKELEKQKTKNKKQ